VLLEKLVSAQIHWSEEGYPSSSQYQDKYFSLDGIGESKYVFIEGNKLQQQWQKFNLSEFNLLETGFGSGLNFILTFELWKKQIDKGLLGSTQVQYFSIENAPLRLSDFKKIIKLWPKYTATANQLLLKLPQPAPGRHLLKFNYKQHCFHLYLLYADVELALKDLQLEKKLLVNAFFLDGFSPTKNHKMWSPVIFKQLRNLAAKNATLATYTASTAVFNSLQQNGFSVTKKTGFKNKREMITAINTHVNKAPLVNNSRKLKGKHYAVIGAGLSGCVTAAKLAQQGASISLIDSADSVCQGASGNEYGLAYPRLSNGYDGICLLHMTAINFLQRELIQLQDVGYDFSGLKLELDQENPNNRINKQTLKKLNLNSDFAVIKKNALSSSHHLNFVSCGKLNFSSFARAYLSQPQGSSDNDIKFHFDTKITSIVNCNQKWKLDGSAILNNKVFDGVVICSGFQQIPSLQQFDSYTKPVAGQIDLFQVNQPQQQTIKAICASKYLIPLENNHYWVGASYRDNSKETQFNPNEMEIHRQFLAQQLNIKTAQIQHIKTRLGVRLTSNDRLPIVGSVADEKEFQNWYQQQLKRPNTASTMPILKGLYVNTAHGSHGLTTIPLLTEHLVKTILGQPSPLHSCLQQAIFPQRFAQRQIRRTQ
jgi:tRNA 5-methylaminomethyl-2-thiouridine biosynthesis bifunctional protein